MYEKDAGRILSVGTGDQGVLHGVPHPKNDIRSGNGLENIGECLLEIVVGCRFHWRYRQKLVNAVRIIGIPGSKGDESFSHEILPCLPQLVEAECGHGSFEDVESPTGKSFVVGGKGEKEVEGEFFRLEVGEKAFRSQPMINPRKGSRDFTDEILNDGMQRFVERHGRFSMKSDRERDHDDPATKVRIDCRMENRQKIRKRYERQDFPNRRESYNSKKPEITCNTKFREFRKNKQPEEKSRKKIQLIEIFVEEVNSKSLPLEQVMNSLYEEFDERLCFRAPRIPVALRRGRRRGRLSDHRRDRTDRIVRVNGLRRLIHDSIQLAWSLRVRFLFFSFEAGCHQPRCALSLHRLVMFIAFGVFLWFEEPFTCIGNEQ